MDLRGANHSLQLESKPSICGQRIAGRQDIKPHAFQALITKSASIER